MTWKYLGEELFENDRGDLVSITDFVFYVNTLEEKKLNAIEKDYSICPDCHTKMELDEEYMIRHFGEYVEKDMVFWCNNCEESYTGGKKS